MSAARGITAVRVTTLFVTYRLRIGETGPVRIDHFSRTLTSYRHSSRRIKAKALIGVKGVVRFNLSALPVTSTFRESVGRGGDDEKR